MPHLPTPAESLRQAISFLLLQAGAHNQYYETELHTYALWDHEPICLLLCLLAGMEQFEELC